MEEGVEENVFGRGGGCVGKEEKIGCALEECFFYIMYVWKR